MRTQHWTPRIGHLALAFTLVSGLALAGPAPKPTKDRVSEDGMDGRARVMHEAFVRDGRGRIVEVPVTVDISKVMRDGRLAILGAYIARVEFDRDSVQFLGARAGSDRHFVEPTFTDVENANKWGFAKIVDVQPDIDEPTGTINVAVARFREKINGGADSIYVTFESLSATTMRDSNGNIIGDLEIPVLRDEADQRHAFTAPNPLVGPGSEGATPMTSAALNTFVNGSTATDNCTPMGSLVHLPSRIGVTDITPTTFFPHGVTAVTFRWQDAALNIGTANANATVEIWGDADTSFTTTALDLLLLRQNLAGALACGVPPATPRCDLMDNNRTGTITALDLLRLRQYLALNLPCLI